MITKPNLNQLLLILYQSIFRVGFRSTEKSNMVLRFGFFMLLRFKWLQRRWCGNSQYHLEYSRNRFAWTNFVKIKRRSCRLPFICSSRFQRSNHCSHGILCWIFVCKHLRAPVYTPVLIKSVLKRRVYVYTNTLPRSFLFRFVFAHRHDTEIFVCCWNPQQEWQLNLIETRWHAVMLMKSWPLSEMCYKHSPSSANCAKRTHFAFKKQTNWIFRNVVLTTMSRPSPSLLFYSEPGKWWFTYAKPPNLYIFSMRNWDEMEWKNERRKRNHSQWKIRMKKTPWKYSAHELY